MTTKTRLENVLKKARKTLVSHKSIPTTFCIRSKNAAIPPVTIYPHWYDQADKTRGIVELHKICREIEAREVLIVGEVYLDEDNNPGSEGILVSLEDCAGMQTIILPYKMSERGKVTFEKERWVSAEKKDIAGRLVGIVQ